MVTEGILAKKILVIEDEEAVLDDMQELFAFEGFEARGAADGLLGIQLAREFLPDLIICDIMMPGLDGYEVLEELRRDSSTATTPFIFLTARVEREDMRRGMELGADDYITKPYTRHELLAAVRARLDKQSAVEKQRLRTLSHRLVEAQEAERQRIAHELHNEIGQILTALKVILGLGKRLSMETIKFKLDEAQELVDELIARTGELSLDLRPTLLDDLGLLPALLQFFNRYADQTQIKVGFRHSGLERRFGPEVEVAVYRIVQEALSNVAHHANTSYVTVQVWVDQDAMGVQIDDQGEGFDFESVISAGHADGLMRMHERAAALGGQLSVASAPGAGTSVVARLPIEMQEAGEAEQPIAQFSRLSEIPAAVQERLPKTGNNYTDKRLSDRESRASTRIVLADGHDLIRQGLRNLLEAEPKFTIVGEATRERETLELVEQLRPDVLIVDWTISLNIVVQVAQQLPQTHILVLSMSADEAYALEALRKGATGYALKTSSADELVHAVQDVATGRRYLSPMLSERVLEFYVNERAEDKTLDVYGTLTSREREIFQFVTTGLSNAEIAERLSISPRTVETHRANMMHKLGLRTQSDLIRYAVRRGLISLED